MLYIANLEPKLNFPDVHQNTFPCTRQGCPLSPIEGYCINNQEFKLSLYADNVILFLTDPLISLPNLFTALDTFNRLSGLGVNPSKCVAMPINLPHSLVSSLKSRFEFSWNMKSLQYLGVRLAHL